MNQWAPIASCGGVSVIGGPIAMEAVQITGPNTCAPLAARNGSPDGLFFMLVLNGMVFLPIGADSPIDSTTGVGANPPFTVSGNQITWLSPIYGFNVGDTMVCAYSYGGMNVS